MQSLLIYGSATKSILKKNRICSAENHSSNVFQEKIDSLQEILQRNKILTVFELFIVENVKERFRQLRQNGVLQKLLLIWLLKSRIVPDGTNKVSTQLRTVEQLSNGNLWVNY